MSVHNEIKNSVQKIDERKLVNSLAPRGVDWTFWEVMVRETKLMLHSVYADNSYRTLNEEEFLTYVKEVEAILNSRPLPALTDDPNDFGYLSPMSILNLCLNLLSLSGKSLKLMACVVRGERPNEWRTIFGGVGACFIYQLCKSVISGLVK